MRPFVEGHVNVVIEEFSPEMYTSQVVNGINYIIKVSKISRSARYHNHTCILSILRDQFSFFLLLSRGSLVPRPRVTLE